MHATGRALVSYSPRYSPLSHATRVTMNADPDDVAAYWTWRRSPTARDTETGAPCIEIVRADVVIVSTSTTEQCGARLANALNRAYGLAGAPVYNERTGALVPAAG